jgi:RNA polymerase sigma-70 factor (ECF subfamily)
MADVDDARPIEELLAHRRFVRAVARALVRDATNAEDVEQETWLRALRAPPAVDAGIRAWLKRVVRSVASDATRKDVRREAREVSVAGPEAQPSAAEIAGRLEVERKLVAAVEALDERYRRVVFLRFFEELPPRAIAKRLACPVATVRTQVARALQQMREQLDRKHEGGRAEWLGALAPLTRVAMSATAVKAAGLAAALLLVVAAVALRARGTSGATPVAAGASTESAAIADAPASTKTGPAVIDAGRTSEPNPSPTAATFTGTVVGPLRTPIAGAEVVARSRSDGREQRTTRTDRDGKFRFDAPMTGAWDFDARARGFTSSRHWLSVSEGESLSQLRFTLWSARDLDGEIVDDAGRPVAGARIDAPYDGNNREWLGTFATSDANGEFVLADVPLHSFQVDVFATGFPPKWHVAAPRAGEPLHIVLDQADVATLEARLDDRVTGIDAGTSLFVNVVPLVDGQEDHERNRSLSLVLPARSAALADLAPGTYDLSAGGRDRSVRVAPNRIELSSGQHSVVLLTVGPLPPPLKYSGHVVDPAGAPVGGIEFLVARWTSDPAALRVACDEVGGFAFEFAPTGRAPLYAWPADVERCFESSGAPDRAALVDSGGRDLVLTLRSCERIDGRTVDSAGRPLAECTVTFKSGDLSGPSLALTRTDFDGRFTCTGRLAHDELLAQLEGEFGQQVLPITPSLHESERRRDVVLRIGALATIRGRVVDEDGRPVAGAWLRTSREPGMPGIREEWSLGGIANAVTDEAGRFVLDRVNPASRSVFVGLDPATTTSVVAIPLSIGDGELREGVEWVLPLRSAAARFVRVRVRWDDGKPETKALVSVPSDDRMGPKWVDLTGRLELGPFDATAIRVCSFVDRKTPAGLELGRSPIIEVAVGGPEVELVLSRSRMGRAVAQLPAWITPADLSGFEVFVQHRNEDGDGWSGASAIPFSIEGGTLSIGPLSAGRYHEMYFRSPNLKYAEVEAVIPPDGVVDLGVLPLERAPSTWLTIVDRSGRPVEGAEFLEGAMWSVINGDIMNVGAVRRPDAQGRVSVPGNLYRAVVRAPGCAPLEWERSADADATVTLLPAGSLELRDLPIVPGERQSMWTLEVELRADDSERGSYDRMLRGGGTNGWKNGTRIENLPAVPVTLHFYVQDPGGAIDRPESPRDGVYYRVDATVIAGAVTPVSIAPKR